MDINTLRTYAAIIVSVLVVILTTVIATIAYITQDQSTTEMVSGAVVAQFVAVVSYWIGSSVSSHQKDVELAKRNSNGGGGPPA